MSTVRARVPAAAAWSSERDALVQALRWVREDASAGWRAEYAAQECPTPDGGGQR